MQTAVLVTPGDDLPTRDLSSERAVGADVAPAGIPRTAAGCGGGGGSLPGRTTLQSLTPHAEVSLRVGPGAAVTLQAPAGVAAANLVIRRLA